MVGQITTFSPKGRRQLCSNKFYSCQLIPQKLVLMPMESEEGEWEREEGRGGKKPSVVYGQIIPMPSSPISQFKQSTQLQVSV